MVTERWVGAGVVKRGWRIGVLENRGKRLSKGRK